MKKNFGNNWIPYGQTALIAGLAFFLLATTYLIKEAGIEVGRWTEEDGKNEIQEIQQDKRQSPSPNMASAPAPPVPEKRPASWVYNSKGYQSVTARQKNTHEPMALYFHATWCPYCSAFEKKILASNKVIQGLSEVPRVKIDVEKEPGLAARYGIDSFPQFLVVSAGGNMASIPTSVSPDEFLENCRKAGLKIKT